MLLAALSLLALPLPAQEEDSGAELRGRATVYRVDRAITLDGEPIDNASIVVRDGVIEKIGSAMVLPEGARVHDLRGGGSTAMPPLVLSHHDPGGARNGNNGRYTAHDGLELDEDALPDLLELGVLLVGLDPGGTGIPGRTSVIDTTSTEPTPDPLVRDLHLKFTVRANRAAKDVLRNAFRDADSAIEKEKKAREDWEKARKEWEEKQKAEKEKAEKEGEGQGENGGGGAGGGSNARPQDDGSGNGGGKGGESKEPPKEFAAPEVDPNLVPVVEWVRKERVAQVWVNDAAAWLHWLDILDDRDVAWEVVLGAGGFRGNNLHEVADSLADAGVRVYVRSQIDFLPNTRIRMNLPAELLAAGVERIVLEPGSSGVGGWRGSVAELVREGLDEQAALRAMTLEPAAAIGQDELVQALKPGAPATFLVLDGGALDPTAEVEFVLQDGKVLYDRSRDEESER